MVTELQSGKQWYVLHTYSGYENKVKQNLEMRITSMGMEEFIFRVVVPEEEHVETTKTGKKKTVNTKIFPGYVLVEMIMSDEAWFVVRNTPGVTGFLGSHGQGSKPTPLLDEEVHNILRDLGMKTKNRDISFETGEVVKITGGAFNGLEGKVEEIDDEHERLKVSVEMFGRETMADVEYDQVDKY